MKKRKGRPSRLKQILEWVYKYHGRVKIFAETLRKNGMEL